MSTPLRTARQSRSWHAPNTHIPALQALLGYAGFTTVLGLCAIHIYHEQPEWTIREKIQTLLSVLDTKGLLPFLRAPEVSQRHRTVD